MAGSYKLAVFIRASNDMDHIVPVVYQFKQRYPDAEITVWIADYLSSHEQDFRLAHIKAQGVTVRHVLEAENWPRIMRRLYFRAIESRWMLCSFCGRVFLKYFARRKIGTENFARWFFAQDEVQNLSAILNDHTASLYRHIAIHAADRNIATLALPHSTDNFDNFMIGKAQLDPYKIEPAKERFPFDRVIVTSAHMKDFMLRFGRAPEERLAVLGSARFCQKWQDILAQITPAGSTLPKEKGAYKIAFMLPKRGKNTFEDEVVRIIKTLGRMENVQIAVKYHTRAEKFETVRAANILNCGRDVQSRTLIDWADLTLFTATSVIADNIMQDKPVLHLRRTMNNKIMFERYIRSWEIDCRDELCETIFRLQSGEQTRTYTLEERDALIQALIEPAGPDVLDLYVDEITSVIEHKREARMVHR